MKRVIAITILLAGVSLVAMPASLVWSDGTEAVCYSVMGSHDPVVEVAAKMFCDDMEMVTGRRAEAMKDGTIQIWQADRNARQLKKLSSWGIPTDSIHSHFDAFWIGVRQGKIVIVGNNGRGCAYGLLELSRMAGVSPWVWWGDVMPERKELLVIDTQYETFQKPSVQYRGIFINDEDWSLRQWSWQTVEKSDKHHSFGPKTYKEIYKLLLRLRANTLWPAMHEGTPAFFTVAGNKEMADSCGIVIGTSHCEPLLRNNVTEWDVKALGRYNYITNLDAVRRYWTERLKEVKGAEYLFTIGMRGIHDGSMEGVRTAEEKLNGLQQAIDDQRMLLGKYISKDVANIPQVFIPYKEVLEIMENGLQVPDDVTLMWCDDNYGYMTRLPDDAQQRRSGGGGVYYHLSYWGRPHDHLWLTTTQPGLIFSEMKAAYNHNCRRLWIVNVHDPKVAAYDLELFLDMAWNIESLTTSLSPTGEGSGHTVTLDEHLQRWLSTQFGQQVATGIFSAMREFYRLNGQRRPEFMGWTQVELNKQRYPSGLSPVAQTEFTRSEAVSRLADFGRIKAVVEAYARLVPPRLQDAYYAAVLYPVLASEAMNRKLLSDSVESQRAYEDIQRLTDRYNQLADGKWHGIMSAMPRNLPVFGNAALALADENDTEQERIERNAADYTLASPSAQTVQMLGHSMQAVVLPKGGELIYDFETTQQGKARLWTAMIPTQPSDTGDLRYSVTIDGAEPVVYSLKEPFRSERWKRNVLRGQTLRSTDVTLDKGRHTLSITALDDHIIADQWMLDFQSDRNFYVITPNTKQP